MDVDGKVSLTIKELDGLRETIKELQADNLAYASKEREVKIDITLEDRSYSIGQYKDNFGPYGNIVSREAIGTKYPTVNKVEYRNLEDIRILLRNDAREQVREELETANEYVQLRDQEIVRLKKAHGILGDDYNQKLKDQAENHRLEEQKLLDRIRELEGKAVEKTKDKQLAQLTEQLAEATRRFDIQEKSVKVLQSCLDEEKAKTWYQKLFS